jgi:TatD DNase family protein
MHLFDSHCHLQDERLAPGLDEALRRAAAAGVRGLMCCGSAESDWPAVRALPGRFPGVAVSFGLHPWYVRDRTPGWREALRAVLASVPSGVGEIGLDQAIEGADMADQERVFAEQYALSMELGRPASLHCRRAWGRLMERLRAFGPHPTGFVVHSYSGATELIAPLVQLNGYLSFSGSLTRPANARGHQAVRAVPADRLLLETDAPDIPPALPDGEPCTVNEPANLRYVVEAAARLRGARPEALAAQAWANAARLFSAVLGPGFAAGVSA